MEQIKHNTDDRKNEENTILEALIPNREKEIKIACTHKTIYTRKHRTRPTERPKERNCWNCNAPTSNPNHKCPARESIYINCKKKRHFATACRLEHRKQQENKGITEPEETKYSDTESRSI